MKVLNVKRAEKRKPTMNERIHERVSCRFFPKKMDKNPKHRFFKPNKHFHFRNIKKNRRTDIGF